MDTCRRAPKMPAALVVMCVLWAGVLSGEARAQQKPAKPTKLDPAMTQEINALVKIVNGVVAGQPAPSDFPITWQNHYLKSREQRTFVPYSVLVPQGALSTPSVSMYVRVARKDAAGTPAPADKERDPKAPPAEFPFEDAYFGELKTTDSSGTLRVSRALSVAPGEYDVYVIVHERRPGSDKKNSPAGKISLIKQPITVPNYHVPELMTSSIIVADRLEPLTAPVPEGQMAEQPYTFGQTRFVPALEGRKFSKKEELSVVFLVYNAADANKKPDVAIEYNFYQKLESGEKYFNRTSPQAFNAETLPPQFDSAAGHQIVGGQTVPLASFPEGNYRLEIKVTDKIASKTLVQNVFFTVTP